MLRAFGLQHGVKTIPSMTLTHYASIDDRVLALSRGCQVHMSKPVEPVELVLTIASLAGRKHRTPDQVLWGL
ncbi:MAG: hypothetical protein QOH96_722 [Blastocatellia bacterium]|nr:hypothetical protein [Blastocatellia bacterium]